MEGLFEGGCAFGRGVDGEAGFEGHEGDHVGQGVELLALHGYVGVGVVVGGVRVLDVEDLGKGVGPSDDFLLDGDCLVWG